MLTAHHLFKSYGIDPILQDVSFSISTGNRVGLIGPNGCGKTTLLQILMGKESLNQGTVAFTRPGLRIGYLSQGFDLDPQMTLDEVIHQIIGNTPELEAEIVALSTALTVNPDLPELLAAYDTALQRLEAASFRPHPSTILGPLGLSGLPGNQQVGTLSGGQKTRLNLAEVLLSEPHLLLLDEPTNHLDIAMLEWLEDWLRRFHGAALIVSHDRTFLDHTVTQILELDPLTHSMRQYPGNYSDYLEQKAGERQRQWQEYTHQQDEIARLRSAAAHLRGISKFKKGGKADTGDKFAKGFFANRGLETVRRAKQVEARIERLLTAERVEKPRQSWQLKLDFGDPPHLGQDVLTLDHLTLGYPGQPTLLEEVSLSVRAGQRIVLTGPNGAGKTTLLRAITGRLEPLAGTSRLGASVGLGYMSQEQELLDPALSALETILRAAPFNETEARSFLHYFLFSGDDPLRPTRELSFGERARLELALLVAQGRNFLLLDEPINHLDIPSRTRFEQALAQFEGTILAVVHDRYFIERFATVVWVLEEQKIRQMWRGDGKIGV